MKKCDCPRRGRRSEAYKTMDMDSRLIMNLRDVGHMLRMLYEGKGSQRRVLILLLEGGAMTQRELTEKLGVQPGSASEVIGKLEHAGLLVRTPSESDRRTADVRLTEEGREKAEEAALRRKSRHQEMFSCLTEEEKETLLSLTEKLGGFWEERYREKDWEAGRGEGPRKGHGHGRGHYREGDGQ